MLHVLHQGQAARPVHRRHAGDQCVDQAVQFAGQDVQNGHEAALTEAVERDGPAVRGLHLLTEIPSVAGVVLAGHGLHRRGRVDVLDDPDVGGDALIGKGMDVAFLLVRQKSENVGTQNVGVNDDDGLPRFPDLHLFVPWKDLVKQEPLRLRRQDVAPVVEVEPVDRLDRPNGLRVSVHQQLHEPGLPGRVILQPFAVTVEEAVHAGRHRLVRLAAVIAVHALEGSRQALFGNLQVELNQLQIVEQALQRIRSGQLVLFALRE